jgi:hypothetical protein
MTLLSADSMPQAEPRWTWRALAAAFCGYSALTLVVTWPLVLHLSSALPHDDGDTLLNAASLSWNAHVLPLSQRWLDGFFFFPAGGALALSDHRLGLSLLASPLLWLGLGTVTAHNVTFLMTYPLCAVAAHGLAYALTRRHDAALVCGLAFGFNPFRVEHMPHLELLAAFGMPAALLALHRFVETRRVGWLMAFTMALAVQGLCASYYLLFFLIFVALWVVWFVRWHDWRLGVAIGCGCGLAGLALVPIAIEFLRVHSRLGLSRSLSEIVLYSADLTSIASGSQLLTLWGWTASFNGTEARTFPGLTIIVLSSISAIPAWRRHMQHTPRPAATRLLVAIACAFFVAAAVTYVHGPWQLALGPLRVSTSTTYKPFTIAVVAVLALIAMSPPLRYAWQTRSVFAFYLLAAFVLFFCTLGPQPRVLGHQFLYRPPYAWLMRLPVFDRGVRAPARFAMPGALALSVAAGLAFARLAPRRRTVALGIVAIGILADTWVSGIPLAPVPQVGVVQQVEGCAAELQLPLGGVEGDLKAMYRAMVHGRPTINGNSGYVPPHYRILRAALEAGDAQVLDAVANGCSLVVSLEHGAEFDRWRSLVARHPRHRLTSDDGKWRIYVIDPAPPEARPHGGARLPIETVTANREPGDVRRLGDGDLATVWNAGQLQHGNEEITIDLDRERPVTAIRLALGRFVQDYPRSLDIDCAGDQTEWQSCWRGSTAAAAVRGVLEDPVSTPMEFVVDRAAVRRIRLRQTAVDNLNGWSIAELAVFGQ